MPTAKSSDAENAQLQGSAATGKVIDAAPGMKPGMPWWFWHLFTGVGAILLVAGILVLRSEQQFAQLAQPATGVVIGYTQNKDIENDVWMYAPMIQFETATGEIIGFTSSTKSNKRPYEVGDDIGVLYDPANPEQAKLASAGARYMLPVILLLLSSVVILLGLFGNFYIRPRLSRVS